MNTVFRWALVLVPTLTSLAACTPKVQVDIGQQERSLAPTPVFADPGAKRKIALIDVRGLLVDANRFDLLGAGINPVDRFVAQLGLAENDDNVKAIIVRITSPGGTVTASDIMHQELIRFREVSGKPVVASLGEVAASGGYYLAIGADRIVAEPTSITGSIGVIMPTLNLSEGLGRIGIHSRSIKSGANKDLANPLEPIRDAHYEVLQGLVDEYYARFRGLVVTRRPGIQEADLDAATDGRVFSGARAVSLGLADEVGGVREAFNAAKQLAGLDAAALVKYADPSRPARSAYTVSPTDAPRASSGPGISVELGSLFSLSGAGETSGVYYLWMPASP
jgi:protease IV